MEKELDESNVSEEFISSQLFIQNIFEELKRSRKYDCKLLELCKKHLSDNLNNNSSKKLVVDILELSENNGTTKIALEN